MTRRNVESADVEIVDFGDVVADERVIEFHLRRGGNDEAVFAVVVPEGGDWSSAMFSVDPRAGDIPVAVVEQALAVAREMVRG
ncbi:hypothetical protein [Saccharomonospora cyanea]|uniref:Uncharacterized protein n=1 Tax=Saccharomonospora cyanea NA-134 TaxID=882082 RepID=H5XLT0_9PSEU|nr:hypothetical protein [Saccharomonospora cyanea]EHR60978.1 hypothetical protein SaccyDRAFT_2086 [Saccharomonospora cyanea NA-134]